MSRTLILVKPDAFERGLTGEVIARFERKGLRLVALKQVQIDEELAGSHYEEHSEKPFYGELVEFITRGPLVAMVMEGEEAVAAARQIIGATNPLEAAPGSIRGDFAREVTFNLVHGSDSDQSAEREIGIWFPDLDGWCPAPTRTDDVHMRAEVSRPVVLASRSPQRRELLARLGVEFAVVAPDVEEAHGGDPGDAVLESARRKVMAVQAPGTLVIGCDTEVVLDGRALGKPDDEAAAREYLNLLSGRTHEVLSGLALLGPEAERIREGVARSRVSFRNLGEAEIDRYLAFGEWRERAGGYAIQGLGSTLVEGVEGDLSNVIGLPLALLLELGPELAPTGN